MAGRYLDGTFVAEHLTSINCSWFDSPCTLFGYYCFDVMLWTTVDYELQTLMCLFSPTINNVVCHNSLFEFHSLASFFHDLSQVVKMEVARCTTFATENFLRSATFSILTKVSSQTIIYPNPNQNQKISNLGP